MGCNKSAQGVVYNNVSLSDSGILTLYPQNYLASTSASERPAANVEKNLSQGVFNSGALKRKKTGEN